MKAGIITFSSAYNYGAVLQVYAMQEYLKNLGLEVDVINHRPKEIDNVYKLYNVSGKGNKWIKRAKKINKFIKINVSQRWKIKKKDNFEYFINNVLHTTKPYATLSDIQKDFLQYDVLIAGSDQIWNTEITKGFKPAYFLEFGNKDARRISYAASLGRDDLPEEFVVFYKRYLENFDFISVREEAMKEILKPVTDKPITCVVDPTMLLDKETYDKVKIDTKFKGKDYIYVHFIGKDEKTYEIADKMSRILNLPIVHNREKGLFENELSGQFNERPEQFISVIDNAKYVITNSFHATVFSIIYEKDFITIPHAKRPARMQNLLSKLGLSNHLIEDVRIMPKIDTLKIDYKIVKKKLLEARKESIEFLNNAIYGEIPDKHEENYLKTHNKFNCYGCELCKDICPVHAIEMIEDEEGFKYPKIDKDKCIQCGLCEKNCIYRKKVEKEKNKEYPIVYAASYKDENVLKESSSGGLFTALYKYILSQNGYIVGVKYNDKMVPEYVLSNNEADCKEFRGSKYVAANIDNVREEVKEQLDKEKKVLFIGNPCQIKALKIYLNKDYENLYLVEILCHGVPSQKVFRLYIKYLEEKYNSKVVDFKFRDKESGWGTGKGSTIKVKLDNGKELKELSLYNNFNRAFLNNYIIRPSCYNCELTSNDGLADMTIGDFWGIEKVMPKYAKKEKNGISLVKINNPKGNELFEKISDNLEYYKSTFKQGYRSNHKSSVILSENRYKLMEEIDGVEINRLLEKYNQFKTGKKAKKDIIEKSI